MISFFLRDPKMLYKALESNDMQVFSIQKQGAAASKKEPALADKTPNKSPSPQDNEVNEIIVKIELKKFQNLIENRIKHKNNLLQSDIRRLYPMNKVVDGSARLFEVTSSAIADKKPSTKTERRRQASLDSQGSPSNEQQ